MNRRQMIALAGAAVLLPALLSAEPLPYAPGLVDERLAAGETVFVGFSADWCSTCRAQERTMAALKAENPAYEAAITFVRVDWDQYGRDALATWLNIPRRSTLVVLKGEEELGRVIALTNTMAIRELMDTALAAAVEG